MSFRAVQAILDECQRAGRLSATSRAGASMLSKWMLLLWISRNCDNSSLTCTRSQARLAEELGRSIRTVEAWVRFWRDRGVLKVRGRGGGRARKPNLYELDLVALRLHVDREVARKLAEPTLEAQTPARHTVREKEVSTATPHTNGAGVEAQTPARHTVREKESPKVGAGVEVELPHERRGLAALLPHANGADSSDLSESDIKTDMAGAARERALSGRSRSAAGPKHPTETRSAIDERIGKLIGLQPEANDQEVSRMIANATVEDVRRVRRSLQ